MKIDKTKLILLTATMLITFFVMRAYLYVSPNTNLDIGPYNIHHLFTGLLLIVLGAVPLAISQGPHKLDNISVIVLGLGLSLALDEWVFLIATGGSDAEYLLPVSFWGGLIMVVLACLYALILYLTGTKEKAFNN